MARNWRLGSETNLTGVVETQFQLKRLRKNLKPAGMRGVKKAVRYLLKETKKVTPKKTGFLRKSGTASFETAGGDPTGKIEFSADYAIFVHEILAYRHARGTYAKFLERTVKNKNHMKIAREMIASELAKEEAKIIKNTTRGRR